MQHNGQHRPSGFQRICTWAALSLHAFYGSVLSKTDDDFSEEENYVPSSGSEDSDSIEASGEDHDGSGGSARRIITL